MSLSRKERIKEGRRWLKQQNLSGGKPVVRAYRKHFGVERICAIRDLLKIGGLDPETKRLLHKAASGPGRKECLKEGEKNSQQVRMPH